jgi:hypothetical protein
MQHTIVNLSRINPVVSEIKLMHRDDLHITPYFRAVITKPYGKEQKGIETYIVSISAIELF